MRGFVKYEILHYVFPDGLVHVERRHQEGRRLSSSNQTRAKLMITRSHERATIVSLKRNVRFAAEYLNSVLEDGDQDELMVALRRMAEAFGGVSRVADAANLNATTLYRTLSQRGNPELKSLTAILKAMGLRISVQPR